MKLLLLFSLLMLSVSCSSVFYYPLSEELVYRERMPTQPEDVFFESEDGTRLHAWYFKAQNVKKPKAVIVHFHGNGANLTQHFIALYGAPARGFAYVTFDYRGYGRSEGEATPRGTVKDGVAAIRWMRAKFPDRPLVVFGQSLGGAIALRAVSKIKNEIPVALLAVDSTFPDYRSVAKDAMSRSVLTFVLQPIAWSVVDNSESPKKDIAKLSPIPLLVIHGTRDRVVGYDLGRRIFDLAQEPKEFWTIPDGQHVDFMFREKGKYAEKFFERLSALARP